MFAAPLAALFAVIVAGFLIVDLGWINRKARLISIKSAACQSLFWIGVACGYGALVWRYLDHSRAADFMSSYLTEKMLSTDNLFVIMLLFSFFKIEARYHHRVLFWGILGAVILRGVFIGAGAAVVARFHWLLYGFGLLLIYSAWKLLFVDGDEEVDFSDSRILKFCQRRLPLTLDPHGGKFFLRGKATMLFVVLIMVETTDVIFAVDSIPAVLAITQDPFIAFTSNIFAVMGLRALFFVVEGVMAKFHLLQKGVAVVLAFIGTKMLLDIVGVRVGSLASFGVILATLAASMLASMIFPPTKESIAEEVEI